MADRAKPEVTDQLQAATPAAGEAKVSSAPSFRVGRRGGELRTISGEDLRKAIFDARKGR